MMIRPRFLFPPNETILPQNPTLPELSRISFSSSSRPPGSKCRPKPSKPPHDLRRLTSRIVDLTCRKQLDQIFEEVAAAKRRRGGRLNTIVMNAVLEACVRCGNVDAALRVFEEMGSPKGCGVDSISFGILLKGLGMARRIDKAFEILESIEKDTSIGSHRLSRHIIFGFLNALLEAGDLRRANALVARFRDVLYEGHSVLLYNLLMKGYVRSDFPLGAFTVKDELLRHGLKPDKLTYNTLISARVRSAEIDKAIQLAEEMKQEATKANNAELLPDAITYTTLLKGLASSRDLHSVCKVVVEMKSTLLSIDRTAYTAMVDALLACGSINGALCIFGEIIKLVGNNKDLRPKPHLYLSIMRAFAAIGDFDMVKRFNTRMWPDSVGSISPSAKAEADELLMEAAVNNNQIDIARGLLRRIVNKRRSFSWTSRGALVAIKVEVLSGFANPLLRPHIFPRIIMNDPIEKYMIPFKESRPLLVNLILENVVLRFFKDSAVPVIDDWGSCIGIIHRRDCVQLDASLRSMMRGPPLCVTTSTSVGHVIDLILRKKCTMVVVVRSNDMYESNDTSSSRPLGVFSLDNLSKFAADPSDIHQGKC